MEQITLSILTLLALYVLYSECIKIPSLIKKNKTIFYLLIIGFYLYYSNNVEGMSEADKKGLLALWGSFGGGIIVGFVLGLMWYDRKSCLDKGCD